LAEGHAACCEKKISVDTRRGQSGVLLFLRCMETGELVLAMFRSQSSLEFGASIAEPSMLNLCDAAYRSHVRFADANQLMM